MRTNMGSTGKRLGSGNGRYRFLAKVSFVWSEVVGMFESNEYALHDAVAVAFFYEFNLKMNGEHYADTYFGAGFRSCGYTSAG